ncbi:hypothetical protein [Actinosynnema sp. NPDC023587]|uniref:hypothetical protein n=1 Tax=Actinosynnema sp. NPDC023587 TaxID=3154695 RepID=UPI0033C5C230
MSAEESQELGRRGVMRVKQYLESTTYLQMPWTAYDHGKLCLLQKLDGNKKQYDLSGFFLGDRRFPLYVESKKYTTPGGQGTAYDEYLANAYSITARAIKEDMDQEIEFMWITWHPFRLNHWTRLMDFDYIKEAVLKRPDVLGEIDSKPPEEVVDENICRQVSRRLWMVVLTERQQELVLSPEEVKLAMTVLKREGA